MSEAVLGTVPESAGERDAIHIAMISVCSDFKLQPGERVFLEDGKAYPLLCNPDKKMLTGIVDPYLSESPKIGSLFWMCLFPQTVTSIRHYWSHPGIPDDTSAPTEPVESIKYLTRFAESARMPYQLLLERVSDYCNHDEVWIEYDSDYARGAWYAADEAEFWRHFKAVTGLTPPSDSDWNAPFYCSC